MADCNLSSTQSIELLLFVLFAVVCVFLQLDLLAGATTSKVVMVHASPPSRHHMVGGGAPYQSPMAPLTIVGPDKTGPSDF
jgi:hypothetical protein